VADMLCTSHAVLRDRFALRALLLDIFSLSLSTWIVALAFVSPEIGSRLTPFQWNTRIWLGILSVGTFVLTLVQLKTDWKTKSDAHKRTLDLYAEVKREAGYLMATSDFDEDNYRRVLSRYDLASAVGVEVPEKNFLSLKRRHGLKVLVSKQLDKAPGTSLAIFRARLWFRDNCLWKTNDGKDH
jgi:hypothetical protein